MNWLHFSDFHVGDTRGPQQNALRSMVRTIETEIGKRGITVDLVLLAGDIAYAGLPSEYSRFAEEFLLPLKAIPNVKAARIISVPGNHDVCCTSVYPMLWDTFSSKKKDVFFCEDKDGKALRQSKAAAFDAYSEFVRKHAIQSPDPFSEVSSVYSFSELPVTIVATNTAFFSDENENRRPKSTPVPFASLRRRLSEVGAPKPLLLVGHHSPDAFLETDRKAFRTLLLNNRGLYIHGHEHDPSTHFSGSGTLLTLGFGASYVNSLELVNATKYRNTFALCSLEDRLYVKSFSWDSDIGDWLESTAGHFNELSDATHLELGACKAGSLPTLGANTDAPARALATVPRATAAPSHIVPVGKPGMAIWKHLFNLSEYLRTVMTRGTFKVVELAASDERLDLSIEEGEDRHLVVCIPGVNHVVSQKEVEALNTRLDTEDFATATMLCLGRLSEEARTIYLRLKRTKRIELLSNVDLVAFYPIILSDKQNAFLTIQDAARVKIQVLVSESSVHCLVIVGAEPHTYFFILDANGETISEADPLVAAIRRVGPEYARMPYRGSAAPSVPELSGFADNAYLEKCYGEYNTTKYAALAHVGLRFSDLPLSELYVNATAREVAGNANTKSAAVVEDHLASLPMSDALKTYIQRDMLSSLDSEVSNEISDAREFCQRYGAVLVTGDPGAGKTCFVKSEILAYCARALAGKKVSDWHASHFPVLLQLSEAVAEPDLQAVGLLGIASRLLARHEIGIDADKLKELAAQGKLALFFDGLDEVVSIEKRASVVKMINELCQSHLPAGNRFVVTSRPAAIQVVNLLPTFHKLELQGLNEPNIKVLAQRILSLRLTESPSGAIVDTKSPGSSENELIKKLLDDCRQNPGVNRLAQNPLLLTLLILIYANSGAPAAKRHEIYEQAIRTLASVRGKEAGHAPISTQDLRERLGAVAFSVYTNESGLLPTRSEVCTIIKRVMSEKRGEPIDDREADEFVQKVAESTGLISIGRRSGATNDSVVTFMHHSFLEYFAAIGLSLQLQAVKIEDLVNKPRWHEILTLLAGIIGENADIAPYLARFLKPEHVSSDVAGKILSFAMDCALECDVPSESSQQLLSKALRAEIVTGPAKCDPWVRAELGRRLDSLIQACGGGPFEEVLIALITEGKDDEVAAAVWIASSAFKSTVPSPRLIQAAEAASNRSAESVCISLCRAVGENASFRTDKLLKFVAGALNQGRGRKQAALDAISRVPSVAKDYWAQIIAGMDDDDVDVKRSAANAAIEAGLNADLVALTSSKKDVLLRALRLTEDWSEAPSGAHSNIKKATIERLLDSPEKRNRLIGVGLIPMSDWSEREIYDQLMTIVKAGENREEVTAALISLRHSGPALALMTQGDLKTVMQWFEKGTSDVRAASLRLLAMFTRDVSMINFLKSIDVTTLTTEEVSLYMYAIGAGNVLKADCAEIAGNELLRLTGETSVFSKENIHRVIACLDALQRLEQTTSDRVVARLRAIVEDFRFSDKVRGEALVALPAAALPTPTMIEFLVGYLRRDNPKLESSLVKVPSTFARKCRQDVDYVLSCVRSLPKLEECAVALHKAISTRPISSENEMKLSELRIGVTTIRSIVAAFNEYLARPTTKPS